ncbi:MAG: hypothetical protein MJ077_05795 [Oscillospiraceae bacterium]|nr:hypothetical protein [Oscillospiraceae bacterium]
MKYLLSQSMDGRSEVYSKSRGAVLLGREGRASSLAGALPNPLPLCKAFPDWPEIL